MKSTFFVRRPDCDAEELALLGAKQLLLCVAEPARTKSSGAMDAIAPDGSGAGGKVIVTVSGSAIEAAISAAVLEHLRVVQIPRLKQVLCF